MYYIYNKFCRVQKLSYMSSNKTIQIYNNRYNNKKWVTSQQEHFAKLCVEKNSSTNCSIILQLSI